MFVSSSPSCHSLPAAANGPVTHPAILRAPAAPPTRRPRGRAPFTAVLFLDHVPTTLPATLDSLRWCDEVMVYALSALPPLVSEPAWDNLRWLRAPDLPTAAEEAWRLARHDWLLHVEADEVISPALAAELTSLRPELASCYRLSVQTTFQGRIMNGDRDARRGAIRCFNRRVASWQGSDKGALVLSVGHLRERTLRHPILRQGWEDLGQLLISSHLRAAHWARQRRDARPVPLVSVVIRTAARFTSCYLLQGGILRGRPGFLLSAAEAQTTFWKYLLQHEAAKSGPSGPPAART